MVKCMKIAPVLSESQIRRIEQITQILAPMLRLGFKAI